MGRRSWYADGAEDAVALAPPLVDPSGTFLYPDGTVDFDEEASHEKEDTFMGVNTTTELNGWSLEAHETRKQAEQHLKPAWVNACPYKRCKRHFNRKADLQRHIDAVHERKEKYPCPVKGCFKKTHRTGFTRLDKLKYHVRAIHKDDPMVKCPRSGCSVPLVLMSELPLHIALRKAYTNETSGRYGFEIIEVVNQVLAGYCPVTGCRSREHLESLWQHVTQHLRVDGVRLSESALHQLQKRHIVPIKADGINGELRGTAILL